MRNKKTELAKIMELLNLQGTSLVLSMMNSAMNLFQPII